MIMIMMIVTVMMMMMMMVLVIITRMKTVIMVIEALFKLEDELADLIDNSQCGPLVITSIIV